MPKDSRYTAVNMTKASKADLDTLQVALSSWAGKRLSYGQTITTAMDLLREYGVSIPRTGVSELPPEH